MPWFLGLGLFFFAKYLGVAYGGREADVKRMKAEDEMDYENEEEWEDEEDDGE